MKLAVTAQELSACIDKHREVLSHKIRECGRSEPPSDGAILVLLQTLDALGDIEPTKAGPLNQEHPTE